MVMDKTEYIRLLSAASIDNTSKFVHVDEKRPKRRGRPAQHFHPLLQKEKELRTALRQILPEEIANSLSPKSSRLSHLYGLPKTHKATLSEARHLFQRVAEHKNSAIGKHFLEAHGSKHLLNQGHFNILRKCLSKFDCLVFEMLYIKKLKPCLNTQTDSIRAKLFV